MINIFIRSFICSVFFSLFEAIYYKIEDGYFHTTKEQFIANIIFLPIFLDLYSNLITYFIIRVLLFPFNVWVYEGLVGNILMKLYGKNPAWSYEGKKGSICKGNICITFHYYIRWIVLGLSFELFDFIWDSILI